MESGKDAAAKGVPAAERFCVNELVNYQEGSVVSRQIVKQEKGSVTLLRSTKGKD